MPETPVIRLRQERVAWRGSTEEIIVLDLEHGEYLSLNPSAAAVWEGLDRGAGRGELVELLCRRFRVTRERAGEDVDRLLAQLRERGLLDETQAMPQPSNDGSA